MSLSILIIEDEPLGMERLQRHLQAIDPTFEIAGTAYSIQSSIAWFQTHAPPDLIFMDIDIGDGQCFDIFKQVSIESWIIFTASYDENALKAFKLNGMEYLLKPIKKKDLRESLEKYKNVNEHEKPAKGKINIDKLVKELQRQLLPKEYRQRFLVRQGRKLLVVENHEISYFFTDGRSIFVKTTDKRKLHIDHTFDELKYMLNPQQYFYINNAYFIGLDSVSDIHEYSKGRLCINLVPPVEKKVIIEKDRVQDFKAWLSK